MKNTELHHFENWVAYYFENLCSVHRETVSLRLLVQQYSNLYPGRIPRLLAELVEVSREWTDVQATVAAIRAAN